VFLFECRPLSSTNGKEMLMRATIRRNPNGPLNALCVAFLWVLPAMASANGDGLKLTSDSDAWPRWQTRLNVVSPPPGAAPLGGNALQFGAARLSGDRYFDIGRVGDGGGLRATSALLLGSRTLALGAPSSYGNASLQWRPSTLLAPNADGSLDTGATPYIGLGYSAWWTRAGIGLSADLGLMTQRPALRFTPGSDTLDSNVRALQLLPVFQVNLSYSF
jgi:hypothetical protein